MRFSQALAGCGSLAREQLEAAEVRGSDTKQMRMVATEQMEDGQRGTRRTSEAGPGRGGGTGLGTLGGWAIGTLPVLSLKNCCTV